ncbi:hypothetical protein [Bradyrhizobium nanningense]|uniref:hypothetical protein n=1 Tax=Bradyrhizobium nanningense TaxID=1325118 RepID=UPI001008AAFC|nr:hypothetical protein [Bradyrhizobium nanningense]
MHKTLKSISRAETQSLAPKVRSRCGLIRSGALAGPPVGESLSHRFIVRLVSPLLQSVLLRYPAGNALAPLGTPVDTEGVFDTQSFAHVFGHGRKVYQDH